MFWPVGQKNWAEGNENLYPPLLLWILEEAINSKKCTLRSGYNFLMPAVWILNCLGIWSRNLATGSIRHGSTISTTVWYEGMTLPQADIRRGGCKREVVKVLCSSQDLVSGEWPTHFGGGRPPTFPQTQDHKGVGIL